MEKINQYTILNNIHSYNSNVNLWGIEDNEGNGYEVLTINKDDSYERIINRLILGEIKPMINLEFQGIQKIIECGFSSENNCHFIVYEEIGSYSFLVNSSDHANVRSIIDVAKGLDYLKKKNRQSFIIDSLSIRVNERGLGKLCFLGLFELFKQQGILNKSKLAPNVLEWLIDRKKLKPNFQDDIYSLIKSFQFVLDRLEEEMALSILNKALQKKRVDRYSKYHELIEDLEKLPVHIHNLENQRAVKISTLDKETFQELLDDMNINTWLKVDSKRSEKDKSITGKFSTQNWSGIFIVNAQNYLFIPYSNRERNSKLIISKNSFDEINQLANLNSEKTDLVKQWKTLPDKEREFIEERAFKAKFYKRELSSNKANIDFYLSDVYGKAWKRVKTLKNEKVILFVDDQRIGRIQNYNPKEQIITIADSDCSIDEISPKGELMEDVRQETSQFKKQVEACEKFKESDVVNPSICSILATPENTSMPYVPMVDEYEYEDFNDFIFNSDIKNDPTQKEAVVEALRYKPVYLIQGPPGTGKTTVIVEIIRQILSKQRDSKILITSQSNLAVDNVLEKIDEINRNENSDLQFMRLASDFSLDKDNIKEVIQPHTFEKKLNNWVKKTIDNSNEYLSSKFKKTSKNKELIKFYDFFISTDWKGFTSRLRMSMNYLKRLFEKANSYKEAEGVFVQELGRDFIELKKLQKDWFAFLGGVTVNDGKDRKRSMLNDGSSEVDFLTAMMKDINIIGATCIHIASGKYNNINFKFDYVIMDESSKASPPETLVPINMGQNIILIGDHKQLPPVITREDAVKKKVKEELEDNGLDFSKDFGISLFEQLVSAFNEDYAKQQYIKMLDVQYRMPKQVGSLISKYFYDGKLNNPSDSVIPNYDKHKSHGLNLKSNTSILFISTSNEERPYDNDDKFNRSNRCNVNKIKDILAELNILYSDNLKQAPPFSIGVIAGYRGQVELLKKSIDISGYKNFRIKEEGDKGRATFQNLISINTVDKFQGAERDIIIYDVVRSTRGQSNIGFLDDYRRINVAFSRVKRLLIVVGDSEYLIKRATLNPNSRFKEFKLQEIAKELDENGYVFNNLKEALL